MEPIWRRLIVITCGLLLTFGNALQRLHGPNNDWLTLGLAVLAIACFVWAATVGMRSR